MCRINPLRETVDNATDLTVFGGIRQGEPNSFYALLSGQQLLIRSGPVPFLFGDNFPAEHYVEFAEKHIKPINTGRIGEHFVQFVGA
jgi:hypothetical protein